MAISDADQMEMEARALLRETIERSGWYPTLSPEERRKRIEKDVDQHWYVMAPEATRRLTNRLAGMSSPARVG